MRRSLGTSAAMHNSRKVLLALVAALLAVPAAEIEPLLRRVGAPRPS